MKMIAYRCEHCGKLFHPRRLICDGCGGRDFAEEPLDGFATLLTHTRVHNLPAGIEREYLDFGIVEFENGLRVTGQLDLEHPAVQGMKLKADFGVVREVNGEKKEGYIFKEA